MESHSSPRRQDKLLVMPPVVEEAGQKAVEAGSVQKRRLQVLVGRVNNSLFCRPRGGLFKAI